MKRKIIWLVLIILNVCIIFALTFQNPISTTTLSESVRLKVIDIAKCLGIGDVENSWWSNGHNFRRLAHIPEYFILGISVYGLCINLVSQRHLWIKALLVCLIISFADEVIKGFLPTREFDFVDMMFDFAGYFSAMFIVGVVRALVN
jgi:VanZ family protein